MGRMSLPAAPMGSGCWSCGTELAWQSPCACAPRRSPSCAHPPQPALPSPPSLPIAVTAKVQAAVAPGGSFAKITLPELKAFLKSIKQPVGGKKGDLEERVRAALGGRGGSGGAAPAAVQVGAAAGPA